MVIAAKAFSVHRRDPTHAGSPQHLSAISTCRCVSLTMEIGVWQKHASKSILFTIELSCIIISRSCRSTCSTGGKTRLQYLQTKKLA